MTPKEKAEELAKKFFDNVSPLTKKYAKQCALIAVEEIVNSLKQLDWMEQQNMDREYAYWEQVKQEIEKV